MLFPEVSNGIISILPLVRTDQKFVACFCDSFDLMCRSKDTTIACYKTSWRLFAMYSEKAEEAKLQDLDFVSWQSSKLAFQSSVLYCVPVQT